VLRAPSTLQSTTKVTSTYQTPSLTFLQGKWHVTHSTLPMWKSKRNVSITYTPLPASDPSISADQGTDRLDDLVSYQSLDSDKVQTVRGVDKASGGSRDAWDWRGKGWLMIASSHWEILGWGEEVIAAEGDARNAWVVTYFAKTLFTPAGIDLYSRSQRGLQPDTVEKIKDALAEIEGLSSLASEVFAVKTD